MHLLTVLLILKALAFGKTILESALVNDRGLVDEADPALALLDTIHVLSFVLEVLVEGVNTSAVFLPLVEGANVPARWFLEISLLGEFAVFVKFTVVAVLILLTWGCPPLQLPYFLHSVFVGAGEGVLGRAFLALSAE